MEAAQAELLAKALNGIGVLLYVEVNGTQHRFKLRINELSPASVVYRRNRDHIEDTEYTLLPIAVGESIKNIGKKLFDPGLQCYYDSREHELTGSDYYTTQFGRYVSFESIWKLERICERLTGGMRAKADDLVKKDFDSYYRDAFLRAFRFFSAEMDEFRKQLKIMDGELHLFWEEVGRIYKDLADIEASFATRCPNRRFGIGELDRPDVKAAYKFRNIPRSYQDYRAELGFSKIVTGFHRLGFAEWKWREDFWSVTDFKSAGTIVFGRPMAAQPDLFEEDEK